LLAGSLAFAVSSCTTHDANLQLALAPGAPTVPSMMADVAAGHDATAAGPAIPTPASTEATGVPGTVGQASADVAPVSDSTGQAIAAGNPLLPDVVAYVPTPNPDNPFAAAMPALTAAPATAAGETLPEVALVPQPNPVANGQIPVPVDIQAAGAATPPQAAAYAAAAPAPAPHKPRGFFASLFAPSSGNNIVTRASAHQLPRTEQPQVVALLDEGKTKPLIDANASAKPVVDLVSDDEAPATRHYGAGSPLPGVRSDNSLFEITRKSGIGDNSDVDIDEEGAAPVEVASAGGMARLDPNGLILQRDTVDTACLRPALLAVLKKIEQHYGSKLVVTSGYRSRVHNAAARGAHNSLHMYCAAADVQMPGVSKWELAAYARSMSGRGGVGTYCYTKSVHIDIGPERDWNWRCRRKRHRQG
jgi:uncharacterized protein YcbK (DUF882 family)